MLPVMELDADDDDGKEGKRNEKKKFPGTYEQLLSCLFICSFNSLITRSLFIHYCPFSRWKGGYGAKDNFEMM